MSSDSIACWGRCLPSEHGPGFSFQGEQGGEKEGQSGIVAIYNAPRPIIFFKNKLIFSAHRWVVTAKTPYTAVFCASSHSHSVFLPTQEDLWSSSQPTA